MEGVWLLFQDGRQVRGKKKTESGAPNRFNGLDVVHP
jgi:hypothetical protein